MQARAILLSLHPTTHLVGEASSQHKPGFPALWLEPQALLQCCNGQLLLLVLGTTSNRRCQRLEYIHVPSRLPTLNPEAAMRGHGWRPTALLLQTARAHPPAHLASRPSAIITAGSRRPPTFTQRFQARCHQLVRRAPIASLSIVAALEGVVGIKLVATLLAQGHEQEALPGVKRAPYHAQSVQQRGTSPQGSCPPLAAAPGLGWS